ncbi:MAG TPA: isopeptide-forming domain-containing fimbrial protein [Actinomycetota bacterium]|nr:isopeptide-forming domain-containing fimbrial protein [Actinomycetota bacterium]
MARNPTKRLALRLIALLALVTAGLLPLSPAVAQPAGVPFKDAAFSASSTGTVLHADLLQLLNLRVLDAEVGFAGATANSRGLTEAAINEMQQVFQPQQGGKNSYGRGSGLEVGLLTPVPTTDNTLILSGKAEAAAPPSTDLITKQVGPVNLPPVASVSLLKGQAEANWDPNTCILGEDISKGLGNVADLRLLGGPADVLQGLLQALLATSGSNPERGVGQSLSRTRLVPQINQAGQVLGPNVGVMSETRQTVAPITLFKGVPGAELTIELLGEWVLRAVASGVPGGAFVHYGPGTTNLETPIVRITRTTAAPPEGSGLPDTVNGLPLGLGQTLSLTLQQVLGPQGLVLDNVLGLVDVAIGEDPRAIGGGATTAPEQAADGTRASGAVDVVRVRLLPQGNNLLSNLLGGILGQEGLNLGLQLADVRLGHMEVKAQVPAGGISCPGVNVTKVSDKNEINVGDSFTYTINATNPYDCELRDTRVTDGIAVPSGLRYRIAGTNPAATVSGGQDIITFNDVGNIPPRGRMRDVTIGIQTTDGAGRFLDKAVVDTFCSLENPQTGGRVNVPLRGEVTINVPNVIGKAAPPLPRTGGYLPWVYSAGAMLLAALAGGLLWASRRVRPGSGSG